MAGSRSRKIKVMKYNRDEVFWMSLEEAKKAIADRYEMVAERLDRHPIKNKI